MCGPSSQEKAIAGEQQSLASLLSADFSQRFSEQSSTLQNLNNLLTPIAEAGPDQQGFGAQELAALGTQVGEGVGANYSKATQSLNNVLAARGGGGEVLPTGSSAALQATLASSAADQMSKEQLGITEANYSQGRKNWQEATAGLSALANQYNPGEFSGQAQKGYDSAFGMADKIQQENNQAQAEIIGGIGSIAMDAATFGMGGMTGLVGTGGEGVGGKLGDFFKGGIDALGSK
jgi:hypothetical protein